MISFRTFEMYEQWYMTGAQGNFGYSTKAWITTRVDNTVSCPVIFVLQKKTASRTVAVNVFDHAYQNNAKLASGCITNAYATNIFINEDHRPAWIQLEEHLRVRSTESHVSLLPTKVSADSCFYRHGIGLSQEPSCRLTVDRCFVWFALWFSFERI